MKRKELTKMFPSLAQRNVYYSPRRQNSEEKRNRSISRSSSNSRSPPRRRSRSRSLEKGQVYKGTIVSIKDFGMFVKISRKKEGLVHVSQISQKRLESAWDSGLRVGDRVYAKLIQIRKDGKINLSMKDCN